jgi:hypothetical protein
MLPTVKTMEKMGFKLYGSAGTAEFYTKKGISVRSYFAEI